LTTDYSVELLRDFVNVVSHDPDPNTLVSNLALRTLTHLDCRGVILGVIRHEGFLELIGTYGYPDELTDPYKKIPLWSPLPITDAVRTGKPIVLTSVEEMVEKYPHYPNPQEVENIAISSFPITFGSSVIGAIGFTSIIAPSPNFMSSPVTESFLTLCGIYLQNWKVKLNNPENLDFDISKQALTTRQKQIIRFFSEQLTTDQIAERLNFSPSTIKQDIIKIYELLGVHSRDQVLEIMKKVDLVG